MEVIVLKFPSSGREDKTWGVYISKLVYLHRLLFWHRTTRYYVWSLSLSNNPFTSKVSRELANLIERKNTHPNEYCVRYLSFCLSVTNFDLNYWAALIGSIFSSGKYHHPGPARKNTFLDFFPPGFGQVLITRQVQY